MAKLYFKYGAMGSSKTAQALITKYNYEENDLSVWLIKPSADTRDGAAVLRSRIGLEAQVDISTTTTTQTSTAPPGSPTAASIGWRVRLSPAWFPKPSTLASPIPPSMQTTIIITPITRAIPPIPRRSGGILPS